jgi:lysophospholipase L1-like esterase
MKHMASIKNWVLAISLLINVSFFGITFERLHQRGWLISSKTLIGNLPSDANLSRTELYRQIDGLYSDQSVTVMLGDSLTAGGLWSEWYGDTVVNRGIGGETSAQALNRIDGLAEMHPARLFLETGVNDYNNVDPDITASIVRTMLRRVRDISPETKLYLLSLLPAATAEREIWVSDVNRRFARVAKDENAEWIDLCPMFTKGYLINPKLTTDGVHLSALGYNLWRRLLGSYALR